MDDKHARSKMNDALNLSFGQTYLEAEKYLNPFRCVISLFNVVNYLPNLHSLRDFFQEIFLECVQVVFSF